MPLPEVKGIDVDELVDHTGFQSVYAGFERGPSREIALLVDDRPLDDLHRAAWAAACRRLPGVPGHDHLVPVYSAGLLADGRPYVVTPLVGEGSLADRLEQFGPMPLGAVLDAGLQLVRGLGALHAVGLAHGSVSPSSAVVLDADRVALSPPVLDAVARGGPAPDVPGDVQGLGATLYALLSGEAPRPGRSLAEVADVPRPVVSLLDRALSPDPAARPGSAAELEAELAACAPLADYAERKRWSGRYRGVAQGLAGRGIAPMSSAFGVHQLTPALPPVDAAPPVVAYAPPVVEPALPTAPDHVGDRARDPEPAPEPGAAPEPEAGPEPGAAPGAEAGPAPESGPAPAPERGPAPELAAGPEPVPDAAREAASDTVSEPAPEPASETGVRPDAERAPGAGPASDGAAPTAPRLTGEAARGWRVGAIAAVLVVVVLAVGIALLTRRTAAEPPATTVGATPSAAPVGSTPSAPVVGSTPFASVADTLPAATPTPSTLLSAAATDPPGGDTLCVSAGGPTVPDGTQVTAGAELDQAWELRNCGAASWSGQGWQLVRISGTLEPSVLELAFAEQVQPGQTVVQGARLTAPATPGTAKAVYQLVAPDGRVALGELRMSVTVVP